jgi:hypothetical protein
MIIAGIISIGNAFIPRKYKMLDIRLDNDNNKKTAYAFAFPFSLIKISLLAFDGKVAVKG